MRRAILIALVMVVGCDPLIEDPPPLRARFVRPDSGTEARAIGPLVVEVELEGCDRIDHFDLYDGDDLLLSADLGYLDFDRYADGCEYDQKCVNLFPSDLVGRGVLAPIQLRAEVFCGSSEFTAVTDPILVAASPFTGSVTLEDESAVALRPLSLGRVALQTETALYLVDGAGDRVLASRPGAGAPFVAGGHLYHAAGGQLVRLSTPGLEVDAGPTALDCAPVDMVVGPGAGQLTVYGADCWHVLDSDLAPVASGDLPRAALRGGRAIAGAVRVAAVDGSALAVLEIAAGGVTERDLGVAVSAPTAVALADDGTWLLAHGAGGLVEVDAATAATSAVDGLVDYGDVRAIEARPGGPGVLVWGTTGLVVHEPDSTLATGQTTDLALATARGISFVDDRQRIQSIAIGGGDDGSYGPVPDTWQPLGGAAGGGWLHLAYGTPLGLVVGSIEEPQP